MIQRTGHVTLLVKDYEEAIKFYTYSLGFKKKTDFLLDNGKRWVSIGISSDNGLEFVLVKAESEEAEKLVGKQAADRVFVTLQTDDCKRDYEMLRERGVKFHGEPFEVPWGVEVAFEDLYGNVFDLVQVKI